MPPVIRRVLPAQPKVRVPSRMAAALDPSLDRKYIPPRITLDADAPPYGGETREDQHGPLVTCPIGSFTVLATLRRAWNFVGFAVDPGDFNGVTANIAVTLRTLGRGMNAFVANQGLPAVILGTGTRAFVGFVVGAPCELIFINESTGEGALDIHLVRGSIWGMGEK